MPRLRSLSLLTWLFILSACAMQTAGVRTDDQVLREELARISVVQKEAAAHYEAKEYDRAASGYKSVLESLQNNLGPDHLSVALAANNLAEVYRASGEYADATALYLQALTILRATPDADPLIEANVENNLGLLYQQTGKYEEAERLLRRALKSRRAALGPRHSIVARSMNNLALLYKTLGDYDRALSLYQDALAIQEDVLGQDAPDVAVTLNNLASLHLSLGDYSKAKTLYQRALAIEKKVRGEEDPSLAIPLNNLASLYLQLGKYADARRLYQRTLSILSKRMPSEEDLEEAVVLNNVASLGAIIGDYPKARDEFQRVLAIHRRRLGTQHPDVANSLSNLAWVYQMEGNYPEAQSLYEEALVIRQKALGLRHVALAHSFTNLADLYTMMGEYGRAEPLYKRALVITGEAVGTEHPNVAIIQNDLALLYRILGDYAHAETLFSKALDTTEKALGRSHPQVATILTNMALLHYYQRDFAQAEPLVRRALAIQEQTFDADHPEIASNLVTLARIQRERGQYDRAQALLERALASQQQILGEDHPSVAFTLNSLGKLYKERGDKVRSQERARLEYDVAKRLYHRALAVATSGGRPEILWRVQHNLSRVLAAENNANAATFFGLEAVSTLQGLRRATSSLDKKLQQSFLRSRYQVYRDLAALLISKGRVPEAQQVLGMLKAAEYFDFVRRSADQAPEVLATPHEIEAPFSEYYQFRRDLVDLGQKQAELGQGIRPDPKEQDRIAELNKALGAAQEQFVDYLSNLETELWALTDKSSHPSLDALRETAIPLMGAVRELDAGWVLIHTLIVDDELHLILTTPDTQLVRFSRVRASDLYQAIFDFREAVESQSNHASVRGLGKQLYDWVLKPLESDLGQADARVLVLSLDGALRYLPIAALNDGERYVAERYSIVIYTEAARLNFKERPSRSWRVGGLGATHAPPPLPDLPAVAEELNGIVKEDEADAGILPGLIFFDKDFTKDSMCWFLENKTYSVLHVAGHFSLNASNDRSCRLLLGDGKELSLETIRKGDEKCRFNFQKDLITLSACNTAVGARMLGNGIEVESFGELVQRKGAKSVLATLWRVEDRSTGIFMQLFYRFREEFNMTKAEALSKAQLALLHGWWREPVTGIDRGVLVPFASMDVAREPGTGVTQRYRHPYYWAPFVLMGNGL